MIILEKFLAKVSKDRPPCWEWTASKFRNGYGALRSDGRVVYAHRISYELHCGAIPDGIQVCHRCDNRSCVNPQHLFLGTHADNMADKVAKGRQFRGTSSPTAKLTDADIAAIRAIDGYSQRDIAKSFGISQQHVSNIRVGKRWRHI